jgi:hypothetical protein
MSANLLSNQRLQNSPRQELPAEAGPGAATPTRWSSRIFYVVSALLHVAAAIALSSSLAIGTTTTQAQSDAPTLNPPKPTIARMAIDVGPIKFCEMKIEKLVGGARPQP